MEKITCPHCGHENAQVQKGKKAKSKDIWTKCKKCKKEFEIKC